MSSFEELQKTWQEQDSAGRVKIESEALLKMMRRNHQAVEKNYFFGHYFLAIVFGLIYTPLWIWMGISKEHPWTWYLQIPAFLWVAGFMVVNRRAQEQIVPNPGEPLRESVKHSLARIHHQIRLQKNVLWWYLLPPAVPMAIYFLHVGLLAGNLWGTVTNLLLGFLIFWFAYELIHYSLRKNLEPQRDELNDFLESLDLPEAKAAGVNSFQSRNKKRMNL